ncbi:MAG: hypothetical protein M5U27_12095 [Gaiella sp.]|nr:hypothetical protein [Gaiella sp.]
MNRTPFEPARFRTAETTSTTGPHVRDWQYCGVANATTNGSWAASAWATETR